MGPREGVLVADKFDAFQFAHAHRDEVVWMSQNTNHLHTTDAIEAALRDAVARHDYTFYPLAAGLRGLPELVRADLGLGEEHACVITAGALEALYAMNRALLQPGDEVIATDPSFLPIHHQVAISGATPVEVPIYEAPWKLTIEKARAALTDRSRMLLLIDPINPLGTGYTRAEVKAFAELAREKDLVLVHDITYRDFAFEHALAGEFAPERTVYTYSFSKNCGLAGMRLGALLAPRAIMQKIEPFVISRLGINVLAQRAGLAALESKKEWIGRVVREARENQRLIHETVSKIDGLFMPVYPSSSNTLCVDVSRLGLDPSAIERRLLEEHKVFVRGGPYLSKRFGSRFVRLSFTVPREGVQRFCDAFPRVIDALARKA